MACHSLLFLVQGSIPVDGAFFGSGSGQILLDELQCSGSEASLLECDHSPLYTHDCDHSEDSGVRCQGT